MTYKTMIIKEKKFLEQTDLVELWTDFSRYGTSNFEIQMQAVDNRREYMSSGTSCPFIIDSLAFFISQQK